MPRKLATLTKFDKERQREDVKLLVFAGYAVREAARQANVNEQTAINWSVEDRWMEQLARIKDFASQNKPAKTTAENVAFDIAKTNKQSRAALVQMHNLSIMEQLRQITENPSKIIVETPQDLKALTESTAKVSGDWEDSSANRFAVALNINTLVSSGAITEIPAGTVIQEED